MATCQAFAWEWPEDLPGRSWDRLLSYWDSYERRCKELQQMHDHIWMGKLLIAIGVVVGVHSMVTSSILVRERMLLRDLAFEHCREKREEAAQRIQLRTDQVEVTN